MCVCVFVREYCRLKFAACCHSKPWAISASLLNSLRGDGRWCREKSNRGVAWHQACFALLTVTWLFQCIGPLLRMELKGTMPWRESTSIKSRTTTTRQRCHWDWKCELQDVERAIHPAGFHSAGRFRNDMPRLQAPHVQFSLSTHLVRVSPRPSILQIGHQWDCSQSKTHSDEAKRQSEMWFSVLLPSFDGTGRERCSREITSTHTTLRQCLRWKVWQTCSNVFESLC